MTINSRDLFFVRKIQINFYFKKNKIVQSLFFLENLLFKTFVVKNEVFLSNIKLKWLFDQVTKPEEIDKSLSNLKPLINNKKTKKYLLNLLQDFSNVNNFSDKKNFIKTFKKFNSTFNKIINLTNEKFSTSWEFQILNFFYVSKINEIQKYKRFLFKTKKKVDVAENVFIEFFLKKCNLTKVSKFQYLFNLLKELIKK